MSAGKSTGELIKTASEINRLHRLVTEAAQTSLQYSIEIGTMLIDVKKDVKHGDWEGWLAKHCPEISDRTARVYMRLAKPENADKLEAAANENGNAVADLSVRSAAKLLAKPLTEQQKQDRKAAQQLAEARNKQAAREARGRATPDLEGVINNAAVDEVNTAIDRKWEPKQREELITAQLQKLPTDAIASLLTAALDKAQLTEVFKLVDAFMKQPASPAPPPKSVTPTIARRELAAT